MSGDGRGASVEEPAEREATFGTLPLLKHEREWGFADFSWVNIGLAIATWAFLLGGTTALVVGFERGVAAIVIGNAIGVGIVALAACASTGKYGIEQYTVMRSVFGRNGVRIAVLVFLAVFGLGWASVLSIMFGRATTNVAGEIANREFDPNGLMVSAFGLVAIAVSWLVLWKGPVTIKWLSRFVAPGLVLMSIVMVVLILGESSWSELRGAQPLEPFGDDRLDFMIAVEFNLAAGLGWWPVVGNLSRLTRTPRAAVWPNMIGIGAAAMLGEIVGLMAALTLGSDDPTVWMLPLGGALLGVVALLFVAFANVTSIVSMFYGLGLAIRQAGPAALARVRWAVLTAALFVPVVVLVFFPATMYDNFFKFLVWTALGFAPLSGVTAVDYLVLRRQRIDERALYSREGRYAYWGGFNFAALAAVAAGALVYYLLLNPQSLAHRSPFELVSASVPACLAGALAHLLLTKLVVERAGRGGYAEDRAAARAAEPAHTLAGLENGEPRAAKRA
jgi:NCS1 family nucleobase:cation symporter-1